MATPDDTKSTGTEADANVALPSVESPPLSPATPESKSEEIAPEIEPMIVAASAKAAPAVSRFGFIAAHKRTALLAASITLAAGLGAVIGALASTGFIAPTPRNDVAVIEERKAMQKSIAQLTKEVTTLKAGIDAANRAAQSQIAKITERFDRAPIETTGSIPMPRPAPGNQAVAAQPTRLPVLQGWAISEVRGGYVYVEGNGGELFRIEPGARLPGIGSVEKITQRDGRVMVVTPSGLIVSMRDRRFFEAN